jgi:hypothetical protein
VGEVIDRKRGMGENVPETINHEKAWHDTLPRLQTWFEGSRKTFRAADLLRGLTLQPRELRYGEQALEWAVVIRNSFV